MNIDLSGAVARAKHILTTAKSTAIQKQDWPLVTVLSALDDTLGFEGVVGVVEAEVAKAMTDEAGMPEAPPIHPHGPFGTYGNFFIQGSQVVRTQQSAKEARGYYVHRLELDDLELVTNLFLNTDGPVTQNLIIPQLPPGMPHFRVQATACILKHFGYLGAGRGPQRIRRFEVSDLRRNREALTPWPLH